MVQAILSAIAPVFFVMALGYAAGRLRIVDNRQVDGLNALIMDFALPAALFVATATASRQELFAQEPLFAIFGGVMLLLYLGWTYLPRRASRRDRAASRGFSVITLAIAIALLFPH